MKDWHRLTASIALLLLAGCGSFSRSCANFTGHDVSCIDGVSYLQFPSGATVKYTRDGRVEACGAAPAAPSELPLSHKLR